MQSAYALQDTMSEYARHSVRATDRRCHTYSNEGFSVGDCPGELPGLSAIAVFVDQVTTTLHSPNLGSYLVLAGSVIVMVTAVWGLRCRLSRRAL